MPMTYWKYLLRLNAQMESEEIMGEITITQEEYKTLLECQIRLNQIVDYLAHEDYAGTKDVERFCGIAYPSHEENKND